MNSFQPGWYLIYTRPRHEKKLYDRLREIKIDSFLPTRKILRVWNDRKKYVDEPLFPSYVFVFLNDMQNYYGGIDADGALYYVRVGKKIARVSETIVNSIKLAVSGAKELEVSDCRFQPGHRLVINKGALTGLTCEVVKSECKHKLLVRVELLQRNILMALPEECLIAI